MFATLKSWSNKKQGKKKGILHFNADDRNSCPQEGEPVATTGQWIFCGPLADCPWLPPQARRISEHPWCGAHDFKTWSRLVLFSKENSVRIHKKRRAHKLLFKKRKLMRVCWTPLIVGLLTLLPRLLRPGSDLYLDKRKCGRRSSDPFKMFLDSLVFWQRHPPIELFPSFKQVCTKQPLLLLSTTEEKHALIHEKAHVALIHSEYRICFSIKNRWLGERLLVILLQREDILKILLMHGTSCSL